MIKPWISDERFHKEAWNLVFGRLEVGNTIPDAVVTDDKVVNFGGDASIRCEGLHLE